MICKSLPTMKKQINANSMTQPLKNGPNGNKSILFSLETERKLTLFIGCLLVIFCLFACVGGIFRLIEGIPPSSTKWGIVVGGVCIVAMFIMYYYKTKASVILDSSTLSSDAACSLGCIKLSTVLLIGSVLYEIWAKLWWVDAVTAICIGLIVGYEGYQTVKGAMDKEKFKGGCGCCGASETGLAKYFRNKFEAELNPSTAGEGDDDKCCNDKDDDSCCNTNIQKDACCASEVKSYGAITTKEIKKSSDCGSGNCCSSK